MTDPLVSARRKLKRANLHARAFDRDYARFMNKYDKPTFLGKFEANFTRYVIYVRTGYPDPPEYFSVKFGDAVYNYRCALDHLAWQLVLHGNDPKPRRPQDVQFPIHSLRRDFNSNIGRRLPGADSDTVKFIKSRNAKSGWNSGRNVLVYLADLSNDDKHRNVKLVTAGLHSLSIGRTWTQDCVNLGFAHKTRKPPRFKEGAKVTAFAIRKTGPNPKMHVPSVRVVATVALEDGLIANAVLAEIRAEVELILNAPEVLAAFAKTAAH